jgi:hypothetical protein
VSVTPIFVHDTTTGESSALSAAITEIPVTYHIDPRPFHIVGRETTTPLATTVRQFAIVEPFPVASGSPLDIDVGDVKNGRPFALLYFDPEVAQRIDQVAVCYDRLHPERVQYANGNDVRITHVTMHYRLDGGGWQDLTPQRGTGLFRLNAVEGALLEFQFEYELAVDLQSGLSDINRGYQIGSDFDWVPSHPGVRSIAIGSTFDAPQGDASQAWALPLVDAERR